MIDVEEVLEITLRSIWVSGLATLISSTWSIPTAYLLSKPSRVRNAVASVAESIVGIPTVLVGLLLYFVLSKRGPLGTLKLLYTPYAIVIGQAVLITPLLVATSYRILRYARESFEETAVVLGASPMQAMLISLTESLPGLLSSVVMGFSRAVGELGVALMVGGNIRGLTRVLTTAIALETAMGNFDLAIALGLILVSISVLVMATLKMLRRFQEV